MSQEKIALISVTIENALLKRGGFTLLDEVNSRLYMKFNSSISGCCDRPDYLKEILKEMFGEAHHELLKSISDNLAEFDYNGLISQFIKKINC